MLKASHQNIVHFGFKLISLKYEILEKKMYVNLFHHLIL